MFYDEAKVDVFIDSYEHPDGAPIYAKKLGKRKLCPATPQSRDDHDRELFERPPLVEIHEDKDLDHLADMVANDVARGGGGLWRATNQLGGANGAPYPPPLFWTPPCTWATE